MKPISFLVAIFIAVLAIPQQAAAQSFPAPAGENFKQEGIASWYGPEFDGRPTASGEIFNSALLTAAHPSLPFGTILLVTNRQNNRQVAVKVNDRGPFVASRIIDVSKAAAEQLDMIISGTAHVAIEAIGAPFQDFTAQPDQFTYSQPAPAEPVYTPPVYSQPVQPAYTPPPVYTQPVPQQPAYTPPAVYAQPVPQQPVYTPPAPQVPPEVPVNAPYAPITVTVYPPPQSGQPAQSPLTAPTTNVAPQPAAPQPITQPPVTTPYPEILPAPPVHTGARLIPAITPQPGKVYKIQVGSYKIASNAVETYVKLQKAGLNPDYERFQDFYRVIVRGVRAEDVQSAAVKIEQAGFIEAIIKEE